MKRKRVAGSESDELVTPWYRASVRWDTFGGSTGHDIEWQKVLQRGFILDPTFMGILDVC